MEVDQGVVDTMRPPQFAVPIRRQISMTSADIAVYSSLLALGLSALSLSGTYLLHRRASAAVRHVAQQCQACQAETIEELQVAVPHVHRPEERTRVLSIADTVADVVQRMERVATAELRLREAAGRSEPEHEVAAPERFAIRRTADDFAATEPMPLDTRVQAAGRKRRAATQPLEHA
jgi:hypothetical protein